MRMSMKKKNYFSRWGRRSFESALFYINESGDRINGLYLHNIRFVEYLIEDLSLFPLWSNLCNEKYGCETRVPSSAPIESEFKTLKHIVFPKGTLPLRVYDFVSKHIGYLKGKSLLIEAKAIEQEENLEILEQSNESVDKLVDESVHKYKWVDESVEKPMDEAVDEAVDGVADILTSVTQVHCPVCRNGHTPSGAHSCVVCKKFVHIFDECSKSIGDEEGFGQKRICLICYATDDIDTILKFNTFDNWKN